MVKTPDTEPTRLVVMRHLPSTANEDKLLAGTWDVPLSQLGISLVPDARASVQAFMPLGEIFSSDRKRAISTARRITSRRPRQTRLLRERHLGKLEGTPVTPHFVELLYTPLPKRRNLVFAEDAETDESIMTRWDQFLDRWSQGYKGQTSLAVTHSSMMGSLLDELAGGDEVHKIKNGGYFVLETQGNPKAPELVVVTKSGIIYPYEIEV